MEQVWQRLLTACADRPVRFASLGALGLVAVITTGMLLFYHPQTLTHQPFPDAHEYLDAANRLAHGQGYTTTVKDNAYSSHVHQAVNPPRFPPGMSLVLAPFALVGQFPENVEFGSRLIDVALVIAVGWAAFSLSGWYAALLATIVTSTSDFVLVQTRIVMSDVLAALLTVLCIPLMRCRAPWTVYLLGLVAGFGCVVREAGIVVPVALVIVLTGWDRLRVALAALVPVVGLLAYNWSTFGSPMRTGYGYWLGSFPEYSLSYIWKHPWVPGGEDGFYVTALNIALHPVAFGPSGPYDVLPNAIFYPMLIAGFSAVFGPPLLTLVGLVAAAWKWRWPAARFTLFVVVVTTIAYMANVTQDVRFMATPAFLLVAWGTAALVAAARRVRDRYKVTFTEPMQSVRPTTT